MQFFQAVLGTIQNAVVAGARIVPHLQVVLDTRQRVGEMIHVVDRGHLAIHQQFVADVAIDAGDQLGRALEIEHAQRTTDLGQQARHAGQLLVRPG